MSKESFSPEVHAAATEAASNMKTASIIDELSEIANGKASLPSDVLRPIMRPAGGGAQKPSGGRQS